MKIVSEELAAARRNASSLEPCLKVGEWKYDNSIHHWILPFTVIISQSNLIPETSEWIAVVEECYPKGSIEIYPAIDGGIKETHPHQSNNAGKNYGSFCRSGKLCLFPQDEENAIPDDCDFKLRHYLEACLSWIDQANNGSLCDEGSYIEFPMAATRVDATIFYKEDNISKLVWDKNHDLTSGALFYSKLENNSSIRILNGFETVNGEQILSLQWGNYIENKTIKEVDEGIWIRAQSIPHVNIWQLPHTYGELREWMNSEGYDFDELIQKHSSHLRDGGNHIFAIGVAVPLIKGINPDHLSWFAILLPRLSLPTDFNYSKRSRLYTMDERKVFQRDREIMWIQSYNCAPEQLHSRGLLPESIKGLKILLVGAGALGSHIADNLIRGGIKNLVISDDDEFVAGNVTRHILPIKMTGLKKAKALAIQLNETTPDASVSSTNALNNSTTSSDLVIYDLVIDCSSSAAVLKIFDEFKGISTRLVSCSFGYKAENIYFYSGTVDAFNFDEYCKKFDSYLENDKQRLLNEGLPWEGTGCWSPVFPAMSADVERAAAILTDCIVNTLTSNSANANYLAFIQTRSSDGFIERIERVEL